MKKRTIRAKHLQFNLRLVSFFLFLEMLTRPHFFPLFLSRLLNVDIDIITIPRTTHLTQLPPVFYAEQSGGELRNELDFMPNLDLIAIFQRRGKAVKRDAAMHLEHTALLYIINGEPL